MSDALSTPDREHASPFPAELREIVAFAQYVSFTSTLPEDAASPEEEWRQDPELREHYRRNADHVLRIMEAAGVKVSVAKKKVLDDAIQNLITIPARAAYEL